MGCFDETCALTRTSISEGDSVLLVALTFTRYPNGIYDLNQAIAHAQAITPGQTHSIFRFVGLGEYNSYGGIPEFDPDVPDHLDWWHYQFMVHQSAAEAILGYSLPGPTFTLTESAIELIRLAGLARVQVLGNVLLGRQHVDQTELTLQLLLHQVTGQILSQKQSGLLREFDPRTTDE